MVNINGGEVEAIRKAGIGDKVVEVAVVRRKAVVVSNNEVVNALSDKEKGDNESDDVDQGVDDGSSKALTLLSAM